MKLTVLLEIISGLISRIQIVFDRPRKIIKESPILLTSGSPMTPQVSSKSECLTICLMHHDQTSILTLIFCLHLNFLEVIDKR